MASSMCWSLSTPTLMRSRSSGRPYVFRLRIVSCSSSPRRRSFRLVALVRLVALMAMAVASLLSRAVRFVKQTDVVWHSSGFLSAGVASGHSARQLPACLRGPLVSLLVELELSSSCSPRVARRRVARYDRSSSVRSAFSSRCGCLARGPAPHSVRVRRPLLISTASMVGWNRSCRTLFFGSALRLVLLA
eukprot:GHVN01095859.1.p1 GENE.GHVN01095859.1~~GHVN01095859.1.p1  ORF type:complete len:190 (+),score=1.99 GHVN01095859.1:214-783(+)